MIFLLFSVFLKGIKTEKMFWALSHSYDHVNVERPGPLITRMKLISRMKLTSINTRTSFLTEVSSVWIQRNFKDGRLDSVICSLDGHSRRKCGIGDVGGRLWKREATVGTETVPKTWFKLFCLFKRNTQVKIQTIEGKRLIAKWKIINRFKSSFSSIVVYVFLLLVHRLT